MARLVSRNGVDFYVVDDTPNAYFWGIDGWESSNYKVLKDKSLTHDVIVQAGAWIGPFTMYCGKLYKEVYCLEPDPVARKELERNIECNNLANIQVFDNAFHSENTDITLGSDYSPLGESGTSVFQKGNPITAKGITLRSFYDENQLPKYTMLMLDIEGMEYIVFDDKEFFKEYLPTLNLSFHLPFLTDDNFNHMIENMENIKDLYDIDIEFLKEKRKEFLYNSHYSNNIPNFLEFSLLFEPL